MSRCGGRERPGCGEELLWGSLPDGRKVPLDLAEPVYKLGIYDKETNTYAIERVPGFKVAHGRLCRVKTAPKTTTERTSGRDRASGD